MSEIADQALTREKPRRRAPRAPSARAPREQDRPATRRRLRVNRWALLVLPALVLIAAFYVWPVAKILGRSVTDFSPPEAGGLDNYRWFFDSPVNVKVLERTFVTAGIVTGVCLLLGYPYAYLLTLVGRRARLVLLAVVLVPFWTSLMVRNYAWIVLLQPNGPVNSVLDALGLGRTNLLGTRTAVTIGMSQVLLPFVVLPLYARLRTIDRRLLTAAESLGAPPWKALLRVYLPLSLSGVVAAALLAFVLALGFYITPALLGSPQEAMLSQLLVTQVNQLLAWGHGGAMAAVLLGATLLLLGVLGLVGRGALARSEGSDVTPGGPVAERKGAGPGLPLGDRRADRADPGRADAGRPADEPHRREDVHVPPAELVDGLVRGLSRTRSGTRLCCARSA